MQNLPALFIGLNALLNDPALQSGGRGDRKILVTEVRPEKETPANQLLWTHQSECGKTPVQVMPDTELAIFTHQAQQYCHFHKQGTEIYTVIEGSMSIEVEGQQYSLLAGDTIVINPAAKHLVLDRGTEFLCQVVSVNCKGAGDKFVE